MDCHRIHYLFHKLEKGQTNSTFTQFDVWVIIRRPLQRKRKIPSQTSSQIPISIPSLPPPPSSSLSEKPIGPLQEKQREVSFDPLMQRVVNRLEEIERKVETEVAKPLVKKRRRI